MVANHDSFAGWVAFVGGEVSLVTISSRYVIVKAHPKDEQLEEAARARRPIEACFTPPGRPSWKLAVHATDEGWSADGAPTYGLLPADRSTDMLAPIFDREVLSPGLLRASSLERPWRWCFASAVLELVAFDPDARAFVGEDPDGVTSAFAAAYPDLRKVPVDIVLGTERVTWLPAFLGRRGAHTSICPATFEVGIPANADELGAFIHERMTAGGPSDLAAWQQALHARFSRV
jgi:hypothetical protein